MKVLMFGWEFPPHISGGLGTACEGIVGGLAGNDVDVMFVAPRFKGDEKPGIVTLIAANQIPVRTGHLRSAGSTGILTYFNVNSRLMAYCNVDDYTDAAEVAPLQLPYDLPDDEGIIYAFAGGYGPQLMNEVFRYRYPAIEIAITQQFDVIHAHDWMTFPAAVVAAGISEKPLIVHIHATEFDRSGSNINTDVYEIEKQGMEKADRVIAVSELTKRKIISNYGIAAEKISVVHNAGPDMLFRETNLPAKPFREKIVSFISRITYQKNPEVFLYAAKRLLEKDSGFRFVMAGNGNLLEPMIEKAAELGISSHMHFVGFLDTSGLRKLFSMTDVYVMPSISEPFGISPLEAIRAGVPVIISKQSGVHEVLKYALKVDWWDVGQLADAIYGLAKYKSLSSMLQHEAAAEVHELKWSNQTRKIKRIYEAV